MAWRVAGLLSIAFLASALPPPRRCLLHKKVCVSHCPRQMHPYHTRCDRDTMSQRTCNSPQVYSIGYTCGWSRCDCNGQMLYDEYQGYCVNLEECITYMKGKMSNRRRSQRYRTSKRLKLKDDEDFFHKPDAV